MDEYLRKIQEYCSYVTGSWFTLEVMSHNVGVLKFYYPGQGSTSVRVFDTLEEFLTSNCEEIIRESGFIKVCER